MVRVFFFFCFCLSHQILYVKVTHRVCGAKKVVQHQDSRTASILPFLLMAIHIELYLVLYFCSLRHLDQYEGMGPPSNRVVGVNLSSRAFL